MNNAQDVRCSFLTSDILRGQRIKERNKMKIYTNKNATQEVTSKFDTDKVPATFTIGLLTTTERETMNAQLEDVTEATGQKVVRAMIELGLKGWNNLNDENGNPIPFKTERKSVLGLPERDVITVQLYDLPRIYELWLELVTKIREFNSLKESDAKN